jgi:hypothetical protein
MVNEENVPATPPRLENFTMKYVSASGDEVTYEDIILVEKKTFRFKYRFTRFIFS